MSDIEQKTVEILDKLDTLVTKYTQEVIDGAVTAVSVTAAGNLIWGVVSILCAFAVWWLTANFTKYAINKKQEEGFMSGWDVYAVTGFIAGSVACGFIAIFGVWNLFNIWNWVAIWNPKLALAHRILGL